MAAPFTITSVSNYNANPPSDDGAQTAANRVQWSTQKTKLADPIKTAFDTSETATSTAFGKVVGGAGFTSTAVDYTVTASDQGKIVKVTASGKTITTPDATVVGSPFVFFVLNNSSGDITLDGNGTQTVDGALNTTIPAGCGCMVNTDGSNWFTAGQNYNNTQNAPQGRLTLTSGTPVLSTDTTAATSVFYTPYVGDRVPISTDGATFKMRVFSELTLALVANHLASTVYDVFLFDNSGTITIGTGPAWNNSGAGTSARGTGAGTTQISRIHGLYTNAVSMTARNGSTTYTVAANQGTYIGTILINTIAGQVSVTPQTSQNRICGIWNSHNRVPITLQVQDPTASWSTSAGTRPSNNSQSDRATLVIGLAEETVINTFNQNISFSGPASGFIAIGWNTIASASGQTGSFNPATGQYVYTVRYVSPPFLGVAFAQCMENSNSTNASFTGQAGMLMTSEFRY